LLYLGWSGKEWGVSMMRINAVGCGITRSDRSPGHRQPESKGNRVMEEQGVIVERLLASEGFLV
jgi:hypothetical protein